MSQYQWPSIDAEGLRRQHVSALAGLLDAKQLDHALLSGFDNIRYISDYRANFTYESGFDWFSLLVDTEGSGTMFSPDTDVDDETPFAEMPWITKRVGTASWQAVWTHIPAYVRQLSAALREAGAKRVGIEYLQFEVMDALRQELPDVEFVPITWDLLELRKIKTADEVSLIAAACEVGSLSVYAALEQAQAGMTDTDLVATAIHTAYDHGVEWVSHGLITAQSSGQAGILSFYARDHEFSQGDAFLMDFGVYGRGGYCHDFCRTGFIGEPPEPVTEAHQAVLDSLAEGVDMAKPGVRCSEVAVTINEGLSKRGYETTHYGMGHGIGLRLIELPSVYHRVDLLVSDDPLEEGMVICLEPTTEIEVDGSWVKVKEEDQYVVEANGLRRLTLRPEDGGRLGGPLVAETAARG